MSEKYLFDVEKLSAKLHEIYREESFRQLGEFGHQPRWQQEYKDLPENVKDFDRALARFIISEIVQTVREFAEKVRPTIDLESVCVCVACEKTKKISEQITLALAELEGRNGILHTRGR